MTKETRRNQTPIPIDSAERRKLARKKERARLRRRRDRIRKLVIAAVFAVFMVGAVSTVVGYIQMTDLTKQVEEKKHSLHSWKVNILLSTLRSKILWIFPK